MKKVTKVVIGIMVGSLLLTGCKGNNNTKVPSSNPGNNEQQQIQTVKPDPINKTFNIDEVLNNMQSAVEGKQFTKLTESQIEEKYKFEKYKTLQKVVVSNESENSISEIAMVKLSDSQQTADILIMFSNRVKSLKEKYAENKEVLDMLNSQEGVVIKQQNNVALMIIDKDAASLESKFNEEIHGAETNTVEE